MTLEAPLLAPSARWDASHTAHVLPVMAALQVGVTCLECHTRMTNLALTLSPIRGPLVSVEIRKGFQLLTGGACLGGNLFVAIFILCIFRLRVPTKVAQTVISSAWVWIVTCLMARWRFANERFQYESVNLSRDVLARTIQVDRSIPRPIHMGSEEARWTQPTRPTVIAALTFTGPYTTIIPSQIVGEARKLFPNHLVHIPIVPKPTSEVKFSPSCLRVEQGRMEGL